MTNGLLLDTHSLLWLRAGDRIRMEATFRIGQAIDSGSLFISQMLLWELGLAMRKRRVESRPDLGGLSVEQWTREASLRFNLHFVQLTDAIALEAARVPDIYGYGDPGDCFLIATAHVAHLDLVTRDAKIIELAGRKSEYLTVIQC